MLNEIRAYHNPPACSRYPRSWGAAPFLGYASFVWVARLFAPGITVSILALLRDQARYQPLTPAPRRDIATPLASCRSETQRTIRSQNECLVLRFLSPKTIDRETGLQRAVPLYPGRHKNCCFRKKATPHNANKRSLPKIARSAASFNQIFCKKFTIENYTRQIIISHS